MTVSVDDLKRVIDPITSWPGYPNGAPETVEAGTQHKLSERTHVRRRAIAIFGVVF